MTEIVVLNSKTGADFTCMDCGGHVSVAIHHGEPVCLQCNFLRLFPEEHRWAIREKFFPYTISSPIIYSAALRPSDSP